MSDQSLIIATRTIGENEQRTFSIIFDGYTSVSSPTVTVYQDESSDVTSTVMPSGSHTVSGNRLTLKPLKPSGKSGKLLTIEIQITADGNLIVKHLRFFVARKQSGKVNIR